MQDLGERLWASDVAETFDVVIIGAGHNGLICAAYLGMAGLKVKVVERRADRRRRRGHRGIPSRLPQFGRRLHRQPAQSQGDPRSRSASPRTEDRRAPRAEFPSDRGRPLSAHRRRPHQGGNRQIQRAGCRAISTPSAASSSEIADVLRDLVLRAAAQSRAGLDGSAACARLCASRRRQPAARGSTCQRQRALLDLFAKSAADYLERWFESDPVKAVFGFDAVVGNYASPFTPGTGLCAAAPRLRRGERQERRLGPRHRRHGRDHAGDGESRARARRRYRDRAPACAKSSSSKRRAAGVVLDDGRSHPRARRRGQRQSAAALPSGSCPTRCAAAGFLATACSAGIAAPAPSA